MDILRSSESYEWCVVKSFVSDEPVVVVEVVVVVVVDVVKPELEEYASDESVITVKPGVSSSISSVVTVYEVSVSIVKSDVSDVPVSVDVSEIVDSSVLLDVPDK